MELEEYSSLAHVILEDLITTGIVFDNSRLDRYMKAMDIPFKNLLRKSMRKWKEEREELKRNLAVLNPLWNHYGVNPHLMNKIVFEHSK
jgi:hypothetical protein